MHCSEFRQLILVNFFEWCGNGAELKQEATSQVAETKERPELRLVGSVV